MESAETRMHLQEAHKRVLSIAAVQDHLQASGKGEPIAVAPYLTALCSTLAQSMIGEGHAVALDVVAGAGTVSSNDAVSLGLIVTEAVINSLKHAFPSRTPDDRITVLYDVSGADWTLAIRDNGVGKRYTGAAAKKPGLGTSIVNALAHQLEARVDVASDPSGTIVSIIHDAAAPV